MNIVGVGKSYLQISGSFSMSICVDVVVCMCRCVGVNIVMTFTHKPQCAFLCFRYGLHNISFSHLEDTVELLPEEEVNATGVFLLEENTGVLRTNAPLTRYTHGFFTAFVTASSSLYNTHSDEPAVAKVMVSLNTNMCSTLVIALPQSYSHIISSQIFLIYFYHLPRPSEPV